MTVHAIRIAAAGILLSFATLIQATDGPSKPVPDDAAQLATLLDERVNVLDKMVRILVSQYQVGTVGFERLACAENDLCDARLEQADGDPKKAVAVLTEHVKLANGILAIAKARFEAGTVTEADVLQAQSQCLRVKIKLVRARIRTPPPKSERARK